ncbi:hypothetical protein [Enterococcus ratti]|uniref:Phenylalanyl-tRNA synthetase subunit alpha n=1 Tax=Enterococcus ratti TaxID=150033 RepID=A0A1L8WA03_9ENTE|nr:hypothetical protein [Enterococcus ratti]OJG77854.1 hypothetical protein RV14_GL001488 [Enterococcus ratti]
MGEEYIKKIYFIEETQNIEGSYVEVKTLFVYEDKEKAFLTFQNLSKKRTPFFGLILSEYKIKASESYFYQLLKRWAHLPADFYRTMTILNYQTLAEIKM